MGLDVDRACTSEQLAERVASVVGPERITASASMADTVKTLKSSVESGDRILVCGSFFTVAEWAAQKVSFD